MGKLKYRPNNNTCKFWIMRLRPLCSRVLSFLIAQQPDNGPTNCLCSYLFLKKKTCKTAVCLTLAVQKIRIMHFVVNFSVYGRETKFVAEQAVEASSPQRHQASPLRPFCVFLQHPASFIMHLQPSPASKARVLQTESAFTTESCSFSLVSSALLLGTYWGNCLQKK